MLSVSRNLRIHRNADFAVGRDRYRGRADRGDWPGMLDDPKLGRRSHCRSAVCPGVKSVHPWIKMSHQVKFTALSCIHAYWYKNTKQRADFRRRRARHRSRSSEKRVGGAARSAGRQASLPARDRPVTASAVFTASSSAQTQSLEAESASAHRVGRTKLRLHERTCPPRGPARRTSSSAKALAQRKVLLSETSCADRRRRAPLRRRRPGG